MRNTCPPSRLSLVVLPVLLVGCQQADQTLPFDVSEDDRASAQIGANGGTVSLPPSFSLQFPQGSLPGATNVEVQPRISGPFPGDAGTPVLGSAYDVGPAGTALGEPARVELAVDPALLEVGEEVRLSVAVLRLDGSVVTYQSEYDLTNGVLTAEIDELGPIAAVVSEDAIAVALGVPPDLGGGSFPQPIGPAPSGPAPSSHGGVEFSAACAPDARQCFSSGLIKAYADEVVQERMGEDLYLLDATVEVWLEFLAFDSLTHLPTEAVGYVTMDGDLRARFNSLVTGYDLSEGTTTGPSPDPVPTPLSFDVSGTVMTFFETTTLDGVPDFDEEVEFAVAGIGTSEMLIARFEIEATFSNEDGPDEIGIVTVDVRLRR